MSAHLGHLFDTKQDCFPFQFSDYSKTSLPRLAKGNSKIGGAGGVSNYEVSSENGGIFLIKAGDSAITILLLGYCPFILALSNFKIRRDLCLTA